MTMSRSLNGSLNALYLLIRFVALAGDHHAIALPRHGKRFFNGAPAVGDNDMGKIEGNALDDLLDDRQSDARSGDCRR
jgi:hypothetical protein